MSRVIADPFSHAAPIVPTYVRNLNAVAARCGLDVSPMTVAARSPPNREADDYPDGHLVVTWRGAGAAFMSTGLFTPTQRKTLEAPWDVSTWLSAPAGEDSTIRRNALISGTVSVASGHAVWTIDFGAAPLQVEKKADVEIIRCYGIDAWHGSAKALAATGIDSQRLPVGKRTGKSSGYHSTEPLWGARRQPDGSILYREESTVAFELRQRRYEAYNREERRRLQTLTQRRELSVSPQGPALPLRPSHLRLVIDNSRELQTTVRNRAE